ncbi:hypothetical protein FI667_g2694, partial [Globisporangium splendens]
MPPPRQYVVYASKHDVVVKMRKTAGRHTAQQQSTAASPARVPAPFFGGSEVLRAAERAFGTPSSTASGGIGAPGITGSTELQPQSQQSSSPLSVRDHGALGALSSPLAFGVGTDTSFRATTPFSYSLGDKFTIGVAPPVLRCKRHRRGAKARWTRAHSHNAARPTGAAALARRAAGRAFGAKAFGRHESDSNDFASVWREGDGGFAVRNETYAFTPSAFRNQALPANLKLRSSWVALRQMAPCQAHLEFKAVAPYSTRSPQEEAASKLAQR